MATAYDYTICIDVEIETQSKANLPNKFVDKFDDIQTGIILHLTKVATSYKEEDESDRFAEIFNGGEFQEICATMFGNATVKSVQVYRMEKKPVENPDSEENVKEDITEC